MNQPDSHENLQTIMRLLCSGRLKDEAYKEGFSRSQGRRCAAVPNLHRQASPLKHSGFESCIELRSWSTRTLHIEISNPGLLYSATAPPRLCAQKPRTISNRYNDENQTKHEKREKHNTNHTSHSLTLAVQRAPPNLNPPTSSYHQHQASASPADFP